MSRSTRLTRAGRAGIALAVGLAFAAVPVAAQASQVNLGTVKPFVALGGQAVTNTGPSVLNGQLGVAPGTSLVGFGLPAVVNGATHNNDSVAKIAKNDLTTAYNVAAGQPVAPANDLSTTNLGNRTLTAGAYRYTSDAGLTGPLTLDAQGDPNAQFVFEIGSTLTTAGASSVVLVNGASPCNVYWQVGSSATLDTTTSFQGNLMALTDITLNNGATVIGRMLARNGQISLINNVLNASGCGAGSGSGGGGPGGGGNGGTGNGGGDGTGRTTRNGTAIMRRGTNPRGPNGNCTDGFRATVRGRLIMRVTFRMQGRRLSTVRSSPFSVLVKAANAGNHVIRARVSFKDLTRARTLTFRYRACAAQVRQPRRGPAQLTG
jgi:hypothetical protein